MPYRQPASAPRSAQSSRDRLNPPSCLRLIADLAFLSGCIARLRQDVVGLKGSHCLVRRYAFERGPILPDRL